MMDLLQGFLWDIGWLAIPIAGYFFILGLWASYRRWHVGTPQVNEMRLQRKLMRNERDQLFDELKLPHTAHTDSSGSRKRRSRTRQTSRRSQDGRDNGRSGSRRRRRSRSSSGTSKRRSSSSRKSSSSRSSSGGEKSLSALSAPPPKGSDVPQKDAAPKTTKPRPEPSKKPQTTWTFPVFGSDPKDWEQEPVNTYEGFGLVYEDWPKNADPLQELPSIDEEAAADLNDLGVFRFRQLGLWTRDNIEAFSEELEVRPSICETWVSEAKDRLNKSSSD